MPPIDVERAAITARDREWEAALGDAFNVYDVEPARPPLNPAMVDGWAYRIRQRLRYRTRSSHDFDADDGGDS